MQQPDVVVIGAGAAGLFCAARAGQRGLRVQLLDHAATLAEKIRISGGGRCNFTNLGATPAQFDSANPHYCRSALARYGPADFLGLLKRHGIGWHEKHRGQLFCDDGSPRIIRMLLDECEQGRVERWQPCAVQRVAAHSSGGFELETDRGLLRSPNVVVATGGLSIPKIGATDFGLRLARQFGHSVVEPRPALVPFTLSPPEAAGCAALAGVSLPVRIEAGAAPRRRGFDEDLLFTHRGLSGPAALQASTYWRPGEPLRIDLLAGRDGQTELRAAKAVGARLGPALAQGMPQRLAQSWAQRLGQDPQRLLSDMKDKELASIAQALAGWQPFPSGTEGWRKAEVMAGGVDTRELDSRTMGSRRAPGLFFIGEVVDVTGWLGGYNFQWAWASAAACAEALAATVANRVGAA